ncbi:shikimate kinase [Patescibacteria group bacterium]
MNIVLIGMRGSGKTTVAKILADKLNKKHIELDKLIVKKAGMSIPNIVKRFGWNGFRDLEEKVVFETSNLKNIISDTGGGVILKQKNIRYFRKNSFVFWLQVSIPTLLKRIGIDPNRPSLTGNKDIRLDMEETLKQRQKLYQEASDYTINTEMKKPISIAKEIIDIYKKKEVNAKFKD